MPKGDSLAGGEQSERLFTTLDSVAVAEMIKIFQQFYATKRVATNRKSARFYLDRIVPPIKTLTLY